MTVAKNTPIKNQYAVSRQIPARIEKILVQNGAQEFTWEWDSDGKRSAIRFKLPVADRTLEYRMPIRYDIVKKLLLDRATTQTQVRQVYKQYELTALATVRDFLDASFALKRIKDTGIEEIFLPYQIVGADNLTMFQAMRQQGFLLPARTVTLEEGE